MEEGNPEFSYFQRKMLSESEFKGVTVKEALFNLNQILHDRQCGRKKENNCVPIKCYLSTLNTEFNVIFIYHEFLKSFKM